MSYPMVEPLVLISVLLAACWSFYGLAAPQSRARMQRRAGLWLAQPGHPHWLQRFGLSIQPHTPPAACGSGCSSCGGCPVGDSSAQR